MTDWISADDRLPPMDFEVLAVDRYGEIDFGHYFKGYGGKLCFSSNREISLPTHWAEMPKPPVIADSER